MGLKTILDELGAHLATATGLTQSEELASELQAESRSKAHQHFALDCIDTRGLSARGPGSMPAARGLDLDREHAVRVRFVSMLKPPKRTAFRTHVDNEEKLLRAAFWCDFSNESVHLRHERTARLEPSSDVVVSDIYFTVRDLLTLTNPAA